MSSKQQAVHVYRAIRDGRVVYEATVSPGQNHDRAWHGAIEAARNKDGADG
jgi:hypothetical protein